MTVFKTLPLLLSLMGTGAACAQDLSADIEASKAEGELFVYTNLAADQWTATAEAFNKQYPWVDVKIVDLGSAVFERYYADAASGVRTGDMIVAGGADSWDEFLGKNKLAAFDAPGAADLPAWSKPVPGLYTYSADPAVIIYSKPQMGEKAPDSLHALADLAADPAMNGRMSMPTVAGQFARGATYAWVQHDPGAWDVLDRLGPVTRPERTVGPIIEKVASGEYVAGYFVSGATLFGKMKNPAFSSVVGWSYPKDGTPVVPRLMGVTTDAKSPAAARLMVSFLVSPEGQATVGMGGATPYVAGVDKAKVAGVTYDDVVAGAGGENMIAIDAPGKATTEQRQQFLDHWNSKFRTEK